MNVRTRNSRKRDHRRWVPCAFAPSLDSDEQREQGDASEDEQDRRERTQLCHLDEWTNDQRESRDRGDAAEEVDLMAQWGGCSGSGCWRDRDECNPIAATTSGILMRKTTASRKNRSRRGVRR